MSVILVGSVDGMLFDQDRFTVTEGRRADPDDPHQVMLTEVAAQVLGLHVGQSFEVSGTPNSGSGPGRPFPVTVAGIGLLNRDVVQDQIARFPTYVIATPALTRRRSPTAQRASGVLRRPARRGAGNVPQVERDWNANERYFTDFQVAAQTAQEADESIRPEALALGAFGCIAGLTTLLIALEEMARQRRNRDEDLAVMRSLGASPAMTVADSLIGTAGAMVVGGLLAGAVAVALSPFAPIGPAATRLPRPRDSPRTGP